MKIHTLVTAIVALSAATAVAEHPAEAGGKKHRPHRSILIKVLDKDGDRILSAAEIQGAATALAALDSNSDGTVTREEMRAYRKENRPERAGQKRKEKREGRRKGGEGRPEGKRPQRTASPMNLALDPDGSRDLSAAEIANAPAALAKLDTDGDGSVSRKEAGHGKRRHRSERQEKP